MARRIDIELTSARPDGSWTWRAAGALKPKGVLDGTLLQSGAKAGDVLRVDAEFDIEGVTIVAVLPSKEKRSEPERLEIIGPPRAPEPGVTTSLTRPLRDGDERGGRPRREGGAGRGGPVPSIRKEGGENPDRPPRPAREGGDRGPGGPRPSRSDRPTFDRGSRPGGPKTTGGGPVGGDRRSSGATAGSSGSGGPGGTGGAGDGRPGGGSPGSAGGERRPGGGSSGSHDRRPGGSAGPGGFSGGGERRSGGGSGAGGSGAGGSGAGGSGSGPGGSGGGPGGYGGGPGGSGGGSGSGAGGGSSAGRGPGGERRPSGGGSHGDWPARGSHEGDSRSAGGGSGGAGFNGPGGGHSRGGNGPGPERPKPRRLNPGSTHRNALLESLPPEHRPIAEQLIRGGIPAVRSAIHLEGEKATAEGRPAPNSDALLAIGEELLPKVKSAEWHDRAEAAVKLADELPLRDLRSILDGASSARDEESRNLAAGLRETLERRVEGLRSGWVDEIQTNLAETRVVRALRLSARPPDATTKLPADLAAQLTEAAGKAMSPDTPSERWAAMLEAVAASPIRRQVKPVGLPSDATEPLLQSARQQSGRVPALAAMLGISMPPPPGPIRPIPSPPAR